MTRSIPDSEGSQKENLGATMSNKSKVKSELRGGSAANRGEKRVESDDERAGSQAKSRESTLTTGSDGEEAPGPADHDEDEDDEDTEENGSPNGRKRARLNEDGDALPVKKEEKVARPRRVTLPRDRDGYVPGSIVRVQLENFVTYDWVEFRPGANLNMILGPNGTGKSSIACALCIGLNGAPSILGRSSDLNAFVKHGHDNGYVEIELKGKIGTPNLVIRRKINSKNRSSQFTLNGNPVPAREISERIAELNVQVGNLCSFLPQDRVSEFAAMTPQQLLKETQRTAGDENLTIWHATLVEKGKELAGQQSSLKEDKKVIAQLEEKQKSLEKEVKRYHERRKIEHQITILEIMLPYVTYSLSKVKYDEAKVARDSARTEYKRLEEENKPLKELQAELKEKFDILGKGRTKLKNELADDYTKPVKALHARDAKASQKAEDALDALKTLRRKDKDRTKAIAKAKDDISKWQEKVDNPPQYEDIDAIVEKLKPIRSQKTELDMKRDQLKRAAEALIRDTKDNDRTIEQKEHELKRLDNFQDQKLNNLRAWDSDCASVVAWLQAHKETNPFAKRVALPAYVSLTVKDNRYVNAIESCFSANQIKTFVTHSEEDFRTFNRLFIDTSEAIGKKARVTVWYRPKNEALLTPPPLDVNELQSIGFDGYATDYVDCPEGLQWFLSKEIGMHRTPVALDARRVDEKRAQEALSRQSRDGRPAPNCSYIAGDTFGMVSRSAYGQRKSMNTTRNVQKAKSLVVPTADPAVKRGLEENIVEIKAQNTELNARISEMRKQDQGFADQMQALKMSFDELTKRRQDATAVAKQIKDTQSKLDSIKKHLKDLESKPSAEDERLKLQEDVAKTVKERTKILNEYLGLTQNLIKKQKKLSTMLLEQLQLKANMDAVETLRNERTSEARRVKQAFDEACAHLEETKKDSVKKFHIAKEKLADVGEEVNEEIRQLQQEDGDKAPEDRWTPEKVEVLLETEREKLELNHVTDPAVAELYESRIHQLEGMKASAGQKEKKCLKLEEKIQKTQDLWYPALTHLVTAIGEKFSAAFDRIKIAGEIRIAEHEDYDKWAIEIYVKFRDGEPLTLLNGHRQSGGERSLTTIMYLMSLTEYARAPFSLVDEINQGMDQQYERNVHNQLVNVTCNADSGQYFLITPKLLPSLQYHKEMKILCVNNGEWLPDSKGLGNMGRMIDEFQAKRRAGPSAA